MTNEPKQTYAVGFAIAGTCDNDCFRLWVSVWSRKHNSYRTYASTIPNARYFQVTRALEKKLHNAPRRWKFRPFYAQPGYAIEKRGNEAVFMGQSIIYVR